MDDELFSNFISLLLQVLPVFYGTDEEDAHDHLLKFEQEFVKFFNEDQISDELFFDYFPYSLRDSAFFWFLDLPDSLRSSRLPFQEYFINTFTERRQLNNILRQWQQTFQQSQESLKQTNLQLLQLQAQADELNAGTAASTEEAALQTEEKEEPEDADDEVHFSRIGDIMDFRTWNNDEEESDGDCAEPSPTFSSNQLTQAPPGHLQAFTPAENSEPSDCSKIQGKSSTFTSMYTESHILCKNNFDSVCNNFGNESLHFVPIEELDIQLSIPSSPVAMYMSTGFEERFFDSATLSSQKDSCQNSYTLEVSNAYNDKLLMETSTCNRRTLTLSHLHEYIDPFFPTMPNHCLISFQRRMHTARPWKLKVFILCRGHIAKCLEDDAGVAATKTLAEERKEQLEQLPAALKILDPPFLPGVSNPVA